jgi:glutaredoxin 3
MANTRKIEIFSAGCPCCADAVKTVEEIACPSCEIEVLDMHEASAAKKAAEYGVKSVPAVAVDGKLAGCCVNRGIDENALRAAGIGVPVK